MLNETNKIDATFLLFFALITMVSYSCENKKKVEVENEESAHMTTIHQDEKESKAKLMDLLESLENKNLNQLTNIMSASDEMSLIFTDGTILSGVDSFIEFHRNWFLDTNWTMTHELVDFNCYGNYSTSTVKAYYKEQQRNGKPYHHYMIVSYVLRKAHDGEWMIIKDQSTTFDKTLN
ncbi:hypothetical protein FEE95_13330 [Maribacter algarum]|uniref:Nuclear transport factor 2 family protein n=1 Tax=Maribacter algarum (ex Zhang et al. 2020) TaxID=2578118 RepID=A0A5S3PS21_9FLAO|nr:hypothetical protein [Maribacter algarum]TMM57461.1 hypothetical protein FEE95_13330 [Maribacter algarum]